jgi:voltage-gated potassium channel Kch
MIYITSIYWAVTTIVTVGYGDILPISLSEKILMCVIIIVGASASSYFMGAMSNAFVSLNSSVSKRKVTIAFILIL